jgi:cytochrome c5
MDRNDLWLRDYNRRGLVEALSKTYPAEKTKQAKAEAEIVRKGERLFNKRCMWCHPKEPTLDRSRSLKGWENIAARHEYWEAKWKKGNKLFARKGKKVFANENEKKALVEYLNLVAGAEAALPDRDPSDLRLMFQRLCFDCHATTLGVYDWKKADRKFLDAHAANKFRGSQISKAKKVISYLCDGKYEESKRNSSGR